MIRVVFYFFAVGILAALAAWFADNPGDVLIHWGNYEAQTSVGMWVVGTVLIGVIAYGVLRALRLIMRGPEAFARMRAHQRRAKRLELIVRGFASAAIGDGEGARRALKLAAKGDDLGGLRRLLAAQVAEIERDEPAVEAAYRDLLKHRDTEFLGLRGLYETAMRHGDREAALAFATRAFEARPRSPWLAEQLFRVQTQSGAWELARKTIASERRAGGLSAEAAKRREAVLTAAEALSAQASGDPDKTFTLAQKALSQAPGLVAMAVIVAKAQAAEAQTWAAAGTLEAAWRIYPHPDVADLYRGLKQGETDQQRARRMMGLAEFNPNHVESRLLVAQEAIAIGELRRARRALRPALEMPSARVLMMMSEIAQRTGGGEAEAQAFRTRAIAAPRDAQWACTECTRERADWVPVCDVCGAFDSFAWGAQGAVSGAGLVVASSLPGTIDWKDDLADAAPLPVEPVDAAAQPGAPTDAAAPAPVPAALVETFPPVRQPDDPGPEAHTEPEPEAALRTYY